MAVSQASSSFELRDLFDEVIPVGAKKNRFHQAIPSEVLHVTTEFHFAPQETVSTFESLPVHYQRQLRAQVSSAAEKPMSSDPEKPLVVAEVFCPRRFAPLVEGVGGKCFSFDLSTGFDFRVPAIREQVAAKLKRSPPDLLILCPPCTDEGGWFHLNACTMDMKDYIRRVRQSRLYIRFCCQLFEQQVAAGKQALFEHPKGSQLWTYPEVRKLIQRHFLLTCHMCRYGLRIPHSEHLIRKATNLLVSDESMQVLAKTCPGKSHPMHECHQPVAGSHPEVGQVSKFAGKYTPAFVEAVMETAMELLTLLGT